MNNKAPHQPPDDRWSRFATDFRQGYHRYANWLVGIHWYQFFLLALGLVMTVAVVRYLPPFSWQFPDGQTQVGAPLTPLALWFILISVIVKLSYRGLIQAEAKAAQATEVAESESLKRQVLEARMAAMQAQVEPHFLFNTLASIEHLIETDPARAAKMQRNLIALLRASMPSMREANAQEARDLGRELALVRPYLEILKMRMEERLQLVINVSDGLLSAEFPPMMLTSLVENAIKHGLEPKAEGGHLTLSAEVVHGKLCMNVTDTGLGFGRAATNGTGIGLSNIRERLALLYGNQASLSVTGPATGGTSVTIALPYVVRAQNEAA